MMSPQTHLLRSLPTWFLGVALFILGCPTPDLDVDVGAHQQSNVYGEDDRYEWYEMTEALPEDEALVFRALGRDSTAVVLRDGRLRFDDPDDVRLCQASGSSFPTGWEDACLLRTLGWSVYSSSDFGDDEIPLCPGERHGLQPRAGRCSATLIAEDLVLTSGHCFDEEDDVETSAFVFGWRYESEPAGEARVFRYPVTITPMTDPPYDHEIGEWVELPVPGLGRVSRADVYHAVRARFRLWREERARPTGGTTNSVIYDYAVVQLDRPVSLPRRPAPLEYSRQLPDVGTEMVGLAFGKGLPLKIDVGASVIRHWYCDADFNPGLFCNTHDAFSGGSGGGLFTRDGTLVGAHRGSADDFVFDGEAGCFRVRVVDEMVPEEEWPGSAQHVAWAIEHFCAFGFEDAYATSEICGHRDFRIAGAERCSDGYVEAFDGLVCCQRSCASDADCAAPEWGGRCTEGGFCRREPTCFAGERWARDACGRPVERLPGTWSDCVAGGDGCTQPAEIEPTDQRITLDLSGNRDREMGSCGGYGPEQVMSFTLREPYRFAAVIEEEALVTPEDDEPGSSRWLLYLRGAACADSAGELVCARGGGGVETAIGDLLDAGTYHLVVDTDPADDRGPHAWAGRPTLALSFERLFAGTPDASAPDATVPDAGAADAGRDGAPADADTSPDEGVGGGGCSCSAPGAPSSPTMPPLWLALVGLAALHRR